jgi:hypothetical protein
VPEDVSITGIAPTATRRRGLGGGAARRGGKFQCGSFSRLPRPMPRAGAEAQILVPRIRQTVSRPKKIAGRNVFAIRRCISAVYIARLLEML